MKSLTALFFCLIAQLSIASDIIDTRDLPLRLVDSEWTTEGVTVKFESQGYFIFMNDGGFVNKDYQETHHVTVDGNTIESQSTYFDNSAVKSKFVIDGDSIFYTVTDIDGYQPFVDLELIKVKPKPNTE